MYNIKCEQMKTFTQKADIVRLYKKKDLLPTGGTLQIQRYQQIES